MLSALLLSTALALTPQDAAAILQIEAQRLPPAALDTYVGSADAATRQRAALALGRLRQEAALPSLHKLAGDADPGVRAEAAFALGQTPMSAEAILPLLSGDPEESVRAAAAEALGKQGGADAIPALVAALKDAPPLFHKPVVAEAAAAALGRLAMREIPVAANPAALGALLDQLNRIDVDTRRSAAFALARSSVKVLPDAQSQTLVFAAGNDADPVVRAFLIRATVSLPLSADARAALYGQTAQDPVASVRVATARAAAQTGWTGVTALLKDPDVGVRTEAITATGKQKDVDVAALLLPFLNAGDTPAAADAARTTGDPALDLAAAALEALGDRLPAVTLTDHLDPARPTRIRVAAADVLSDHAALVRLAVHDGEAPVRTAAAGRLMDLHPTNGEVLALFDAFDSEVQSTAAEWVTDHPIAAAEPRLLAAIKSANDTDIDLLQQALLALGKLYEVPVSQEAAPPAPPPRASKHGKARAPAPSKGAPALVRTPSPQAAALVGPLLLHADPHVRAAAEAVARALKLPAAPYTHHGLDVDLAAVSHIRSARIQTTRGEVIVTLDPDDAPLTVSNWANLADKGYFDGLSVHRVVPDFVVQDGDPRGDGCGGPGYTIPDEIAPGHYREGTLGMALSGPDTGGSQWFVTLSPQPHLDGGYTIFGQVTQGMAVLRAMQPGDRILHIVIERSAVPNQPSAISSAG